MSSPATILTPVQLSELGFALVPWRNRKADERKPLIKNFLHDIQTAKDTARTLFAAPDCDWAIIPIDHAVIDIEMKNGLDGERDLLALFPDIDWSIYPQAKSYSGGRHIWVKLPEGWTRKGQLHIADGIEIKCRNATAHIPPSMGYEWINPLTTYDIPVAPDAFLEAWANAKPKTVRNLDSGEKVGPGARHSFLCSVAGSMRNLGLGEQALFACLRETANEKCEKPSEVSDDEIRGIAKSYAEKDADSFDMRLAQGEDTAKSVEAFFKRPVVHSEVQVDRDENDNPRLTEAQLRPTALIAAWVDWILAGANRKQPELSLLAACVGIATCIGRKLVWRGSHANMYAMGLASSGSGKNDPHNSIAKVLEAAGMGDLVGASDIGSDAGLLAQISSKPEIVWPIDEFSIVLEYMHRPNAPAYITYLAKYLLGLFSCDAYNGKALKNEAPLIIPNPYPNLLTWAQPKTFLSVFDDRMANSGFIGRFIIFVGEDLPRLNARAMKTPIPTELIEGLKRARSSTHQLFKTVGATRDTVEIRASDEVIEYYYKKCEETEDIVQKHKGTMQGTLWARTTEKANKFALIHAWSLNPADPEMTIESIDWGFQVVYFANKSLIDMLKTRVVNSQDENVKFVEDVITKAGSTGLTNSRLLMSTSRIERNRRDAILQDLIDCGKIVCITKKSESGKGRPSQKYIATCNMEKDQ